MASPDLAQSANDALVIGGSVSSGIGMPQENDWFAGRGMGMGPGGMGFGPGMMAAWGPGMGDGANLNGDNPQQAIGGGRGGPAARAVRAADAAVSAVRAAVPVAASRGGFGGGRGGPGGGGLGGRGGPGARGGRDGGRGPGGRNMNAFGNGRRNPRMRYNGNLAIIEDNSALNARPYSLTGQDTPKPSTQNARITAMFGGPSRFRTWSAARRPTSTSTTSSRGRAPATLSPRSCPPPPNAPAISPRPPACKARP